MITANGGIGVDCVQVLSPGQLSSAFSTATVFGNAGSGFVGCPGH